MTEIQKILFNHQDEKYGDFISKLVPTEPRESFIGIRSPEYKKIAPQVLSLPENQIADFMNSLPHKYHEENVLHITLINRMDYEQAIAELNNFLPFIKNWAVSDVLGSKSFKKNLDKLIAEIQKWIKDDNPYAKRVAMLFLMKYYLDDAFKPEYLDSPADVRSDEYYVNMMTAWLFAEALAKQWDAALDYLQKNRLDSWTHNKAIQKAVESRKISPEKKEYLKTLKVKIPQKTK